MNSAETPFETHLTVEHEDGNAVQMLHEATKLSKQGVKLAMQNGAVWITRGEKSQRLRRAKRTLKIGDQVHLYYNAKVQAEVPPEPTLIADLGDYSVWRKPFGMRSQGSKWGDHCTIMRWAEQHLQPERISFTVHRLDMAANGLILIAHSKTMAAKLAELFRERRIDKRYRAVVEGDCRQLTEPLRIELPIDEKAAASEVQFMEYDGDTNRSLVEVRIETGRKHQIRRHLSESGFPIVGDRLYGNGEDGDADLQLTAFSLGFHCPIADKPVQYVLAEQWLPKLS